jgi:hypothetical protein
MIQVCAPIGAFSAVEWPDDVVVLEHAFVPEVCRVTRILLLTGACSGWRASARALARVQPMTQLAYVLMPGENTPDKLPLELDWVVASTALLPELRAAVADADTLLARAYVLPASIRESMLPAACILTDADTLFETSIAWFKTQLECINVTVRAPSAWNPADTMVLGIGAMSTLAPRLAAAPVVLLALTEQLASVRDSFTCELAVRATCIFVPSILFVRAARGTPAIASKMCVMPYLWLSGRDESQLPRALPSVTREWTAVQFGHGCPRRLAVHCCLDLLDVPARYETAVFGDSKHALLADAGAVYVPHFYPPPVFTPVHRLSEVIPYGCTLVCEHSQDTAIDALVEAAGGVCFVSYDALAPVVARLAAVGATATGKAPAAWQDVIALIHSPLFTASCSWLETAQRIVQARVAQLAE